MTRRGMHPMRALLLGTLAVGFIAAALALTSGVSSAHGDEQVDTFPQNGVTGLSYADGKWTITLESADADEVKLIKPTQAIACSEHAGEPKNGHPLCDSTSYSFTSEAECVEVQVDWTGNLHNSWDPRACQSTSEPTSVPTETSAPPTSPATPTPTDDSSTPTPHPSTTAGPTPTPTNPVPTSTGTPGPSPSPTTSAPSTPTSSPSNPTSTAPTSVVTVTESPIGTSPEDSARIGNASDQLAATGYDLAPALGAAVVWALVLGLGAVLVTRRAVKK